MSHSVEQGGSPSDPIPEILDTVDHSAPSNVYPFPMGKLLQPALTGPQEAQAYEVEIDITGDNTLERSDIPDLPASYLTDAEIVILNHLRIHPESTFPLYELQKLAAQETAPNQQPVAIVSTALSRLRLLGRMFEVPLVLSSGVYGNRHYQINSAVRYVDYRREAQTVVCLPPPKETEAPLTAPVETLSREGPVPEDQKPTEEPSETTIPTAEDPQAKKPQESEAAASSETSLLRRHEAIVRIVGHFGQHPLMQRKAHKALEEFNINLTRSDRNDYLTFNSAMFRRLQAAIDTLGGLEGLETYDLAADEHPERAVIELVGAYKAIFQANMPFAALIRSKNFAPSYGQLAREDLDQAAYLGLADAITRYDPDQKLFSTYAENWIKQRIQRQIGDYARAIRIPVHAHQFYNKVLITAEELRITLNREVTDKEIASELKVPEEDIAFIRNQKYHLSSLDQPLGESGPGESVSTLGDVALPLQFEQGYKAVEEDELHAEALRKAFNGNTLTRLQKIILGLGNAITPKIVGNDVYTIIGKQRQTYAELYDAFLALDTSAANDEPGRLDITLAKLLGVSKNVAKGAKPDSSEVAHLREEAYTRLIRKHQKARDVPQDFDKKAKPEAEKNIVKKAPDPKHPSPAMMPRKASFTPIAQKETPAAALPETNKESVPAAARETQQPTSHPESVGPRDYTKEIYRAISNITNLGKGNTFSRLQLQSSLRRLGHHLSQQELETVFAQLADHPAVLTMGERTDIFRVNVDGSHHFNQEIVSQDLDTRLHQALGPSRTNPYHRR